MSLRSKYARQVRQTLGSGYHAAWYPEQSLRKLTPCGPDKISSMCHVVARNENPTTIDQPLRMRGATQMN